MDWVLEAIQAPELFAVPLYPSLVEKAALLSWVIIDGHVFYDGNKRTGISALNAFLKTNGFALEVTTEEVVEIALEIARGGSLRVLSREAFGDWITERLRPLVI